MEIIAFSGPRGVGKTLTCRLITDILHDIKDVYHMSFADFLRDWIKLNFGNEVYISSLDREKKDIPFDGTLPIMTAKEVFNVNTNRSPRDLMILAGTFLRSIDENIFCKALEHRIESIEKKDNALVIIDDLRFENEYTWLKEIDYVSTLVLMDRVDLPPNDKMVKDFLDYEKAEYMYQTYSYMDAYNSLENRNSIITMLRTITSLPIRFED